MRELNIDNIYLNAIQVQQYNDQLKKCIEILPSLKTNKEILMAINEIVDATDFIGVDNELTLKIAQILEDKGFKENDFVYDISIYTNLDNHCKYIVGKVLNMIMHCCAIHGIIHTYIGRWLEENDKHENNRKVS